MRTFTILFLLLIAACGTQCEPPPVDAAAPHSLTPVLQSLVDKRLASGVVTLVTDQDGVRDVSAAGLASLDAKRPMRDDCVFWIASMTKPITAAALMMLVDEGKLKIDDPVAKYLPEFQGQVVAANESTPAHPPKRPITVADILTHTSGLVLANDKTLKRESVLAADVAQIAARPLRQEPGTKFEYNNCGLNTAGRMIEVVSGGPYVEFVQRRVFDPLGMRDTTFWPNAEQAQRLARTSRRAADKQSLEEIHHEREITPALIEKLGRGVKVPPPILADMGMGMLVNYAQHYGEPAGGLFSTAADLGNFCRMLLGGGVYEGRRLLSQRAVKEMTAKHTGDVPVSPDEAWGLGWTVKLRDDEGPSVGSFGHRGARRTAMWVDPAHQLATIILVERFDMTGPEQKEFYRPILKAAIENFGKAHR